MKRKQADIAAGVLVVGVLLLGVVGSVQVYLTGGPMNGDSVPAMAFVGPILMSLVVASVVGGVYTFVRGRAFATRADEGTAADGASDPAEATDAGDATDPTPEEPDGPQPSEPVRHRILDVLSDDERRILEPVIESPGLTQIEVRDRSGFSKSKVSRTIPGLEERGLLYRESQGRTYRVYPADDTDERP